MALLCSELLGFLAPGTRIVEFCRRVGARVQAEIHRVVDIQSRAKIGRFCPKQTVRASSQEETSALEIATRSDRDEVNELPMEFWTYQIEAIANLTRRKLNYWVKTAIVKPSRKTAGQHCRFSHEDLRKILVMRVLAEGGMSTHQIRGSIDPIMAALESDGWEPNYEIINGRCPRIPT